MDEQQSIDLLGPRKEVPIPCGKHDDPRQLLPENLVIVAIYWEVQPYMVFLQYQEGKETKSKAVLNPQIVKLFCEEYRVEFLATWDLLKKVHNVFYGYTQDTVRSVL